MMDEEFRSRNAHVARFMTTRWQDVLNARGNTPAARESLRELCDRYYHPVHAFICAYTHHSPDARDSTHAFFARLLEGNSIDRLRRDQGRFRSYLLGSVKHFLADERDKVQAAKRGGAILHQSLDSASDEEGSLAIHEMPPDAYFDRQWAFEILNQSLTLLESEVITTPAGTYFDLLKPWLNGSDSAITQADVAERLGISIEALKGILHRWRKRFREIVKTIVGATVQTRDEIDSELAYLVQCLSSLSRP